MPDLKINFLRENTFYWSLLFYVAVLPYSEALVSIAAGILLAQALILASWKHPSVNIKRYISPLMVSSIFAVYLLGMFVTEDFSFALYELKKVIFWIILPFAFFLSPRLNFKRFKNVLLLFCLAVFTASAIAVIRLIFADQFQISGFREISVISHIRFSFQVVLSLILATYFLLSETKIPFIRYSKIVLYIFLIWMVAFLFLLKSITGIIAFIGTALFFFILFIFRLKSITVKVAGMLGLVILITIPVFYVAGVWKDFYDVEKLDYQMVEKVTPSGNPYWFDFKSKEKENGNWVNAYICEKELREEWNKLSSKKYDSLDDKGFAYKITLIRYLTGKGLRKDSTGVHSLTEHDIMAIESGIANHIYAERGFSVYPRIYETIWELDRYRNTGDPNFQSLSQRIEFVKASFILIRKNPLFGIGTGNWKIKYGEAYQEMDSKLYPENQGPSHNQYLNYMVKFGSIGLIYIFLMLILPLFREGHRRNLFFWLFFIAISIANLADANLETHMGLSFFGFFYSLFLWHSPEEFRTFHLL